jgi:hypothetical protein
MRTAPLLLALSSLLIPLAAVPLAAEDQMLSGAHLSYTALFSGQVKADGRTNDWDSGQRIELHLRDYYFPQQSHHPFAEIGFFYEEHEASTTDLELDTETIAFRVAVGSAIPLWRSVDGKLAAGISPELGAHIGTFTIDAYSPGTHGDDDSFRYGASAGISGWLAINQSFSLGLGLIGSYWRATEVDVLINDGFTTDTVSTNPSGWDLGARLSVGFLF